MKILFLFFLLIGCTSIESNSNVKKQNFDFSDDLSIEEFRIKLENYAINSPYPNID
jgi:hypothetical protein